MDERTHNVIEHGRRIRAVLTQPQYQPLSVAHQVALLLAIEQRLLDRISVDKVVALRARLAEWLNSRSGEHVRRINATGDLGNEGRTALVTAMTELVEQFASEAVPPKQ